MEPEASVPINGASGSLFACFVFLATFQLASNTNSLTPGAHIPRHPSLSCETSWNARAVVGGWRALRALNLGNLYISHEISPCKCHIDTICHPISYLHCISAALQGTIYTPPSQGTPTRSVINPHPYTHTWELIFTSPNLSWHYKPSRPGLQTKSYGGNKSRLTTCSKVSSTRTHFTWPTGMLKESAQMTSSISLISNHLSVEAMPLMRLLCQSWTRPT